MIVNELHVSSIEICNAGSHRSRNAGIIDGFLA